MRLRFAELEHFWWAEYGKNPLTLTLSPWEREQRAWPDERDEWRGLPLWRERASLSRWERGGVRVCCMENDTMLGVLFG